MLLLGLALSLLAPPSSTSEAPSEDVEGISEPEPPLPEPELVEEQPPLPDIRFRLEIDLPVLIGFTGVWGITEGFKDQIAPQECKWCTPGKIDRATRNGLVWSDYDAAALSSDIIAYGVIPALSLTLTLVGVGREGEWRKIHEDLIVALEAVAVSAALANAIKLMTARQRPYARYASEPIPFADDSDQNLGFPSGHTSFAFSLATGFASVATLRGRKLAPVFWGVGVPLAGFVGYLRIAGDRHYLGDVLVGAGLGTLVGVGLPFLLHHPRWGVIPRRTSRSDQHAWWIAPAPGGVVLGGRI